MPLTLRIISYQRDTLGADATRTFASLGGTLGRATRSDWTLPDPERVLSGEHAKVTFEGGHYFLTDTSVNGVFVNESNTPLGTGNRIRLNDGDQLVMGDYEITVTIEPEADLGLPGMGPAAGSGETLDPLELLKGGAAKPAAPVSASPETSKPEPSLPDASMPDLMGGIPDDLDLDIGMGMGAEPDHVPATNESFQAPSYSAPAIPDDWDLDDLAAPEPAAPAPVPAPPAPAPVAAPAAPPKPSPPPIAAPPAPAPAPVPPPLASAPPAPAVAVSGDLLQAFFRGAGMAGAESRIEDPEEMMELIGSLFRGVVSDLRELLMARASIKSGFRMELTMIMQAENNPLKFSAGGVDEALENLLLKRGAGYLAPAEAFSEGFRDIKDHQLAMMAGMQGAFKGLLEKFDPEGIEEKHGAGEKGWFGGSQKKAECWATYTDRFTEVKRLAEDDFQRVFGDEFARGYEKQIKLLDKAHQKK